MMKVECSKCGDLVETTAKTVVAPFVCNADDCQTPTMCDANDMNDSDSMPSPVQKSPLVNWSLEGKANLLKVLANPDVQAELTKGGSYVDYTAVAAAMSASNHETCDSASVENTTLLIEDLQQQLSDERVTILALEEEKEKLANSLQAAANVFGTLYYEAQQQIRNQAATIKEQEGHIDQDLSAILRLMVEKDDLAKQSETLGIRSFNLNRRAAQLIGFCFAQKAKIDKLVQQVKVLDERCSRQSKSIGLYQSQEWKMAEAIENLKQRLTVWMRRAEHAKDLAICRKEHIKSLESRGTFARLLNTGV